MQAKNFFDKIKKRFSRKHNYFLFSLLVLSLLYLILCLAFDYTPPCLKDKKEDEGKDKKNNYEFGSAVEGNLLQNYITALKFEFLQTLKQKNENIKQYWKNLFRSIQYFKSFSKHIETSTNSINQDFEKTGHESLELQCSLINESYNHITNPELSPLVVLNYLKQM